MSNSTSTIETIEGMGCATIQCDVYITCAYILDSTCVAICLASALIILWVAINHCAREKVSYSTVLKHKSKHLYPLTFLIGIIFDLAICIGNLMCKERLSGTTPSTMFGPFFVFFSQFGLILYFFVILKFLRSCGGYGSENNTVDMMTQLLASMAYCIPPASFCCCFIVSFGIHYPRFQNEFIKVYIVGGGLLALLFGSLITYAFRFVLIYLDDHISNFDQVSYEIQSIYKRLKHAYYICGSISAIVGIACVSFGASSYLWNRSNYLFIFMRKVLPICATVLVIITHSPVTEINRSISSTVFLPGDGLEIVLEQTPILEISTKSNRGFSLQIFSLVSGKTSRKTSGKIIPIA
jgi:hypothetical protein